MTNEEAIRVLMYVKREVMADGFIDKVYDMAISALKAQCNNLATDCVSRESVIKLLDDAWVDWHEYQGWLHDEVNMLPSAQQERKWTPCSNPPKHHRDVLVRGIEAIGNVNVYKVMQWDVDTWRPTDYAPSIIWKEWSEI